MAQEHYIGVVAQTSGIGHGTQLINPEDLDPLAPCVVRRMDEDYWRQILTEHWLEPFEPHPGEAWGYARCHCGKWFGGYVREQHNVRAQWVTHVLAVAAVTPEQIQGDPIPDGVPSTLLTVEPEE